MKVNQRFQDLFLPGSAADRWIPLQQVERDICLLYHQLASYSYIMPTLYYGSVFDQAYWDYLNVPEIPEKDGEFIRNGCLVMVLAMCLAEIEGAFSFDAEVFAQIRKAVQGLDTQDEKVRKLANGVLLALDEIDKESYSDEHLTELSEWAHKEFVQGYFRNTVREFDSNPYYT